MGTEHRLAPDMGSKAIRPRPNIINNIKVTLHLSNSRMVALLIALTPNSNHTARLLRVSISISNNHTAHHLKVNISNNHMVPPRKDNTDHPNKDNMERRRRRHYKDTMVLLRKGNMALRCQVNILIPMVSNLATAAPKHHMVPRLPNPMVHLNPIQPLHRLAILLAKGLNTTQVDKQMTLGKQ